MSILKNIVSRNTIVGLALFLMVGAASAELLGVSPGQPNILIFPSGNLPNVSYDAGTDTLTLEGRPIRVSFSDGSRQRVTNGLLTITVDIDEAGTATGGTLLLTGTAANGTTYASPLLQGTFVEYGSSDSAALNGDSLDFRFAVTGGSLETLYGDDDIGVALNLEGSYFSDSFVSSWTASKVKGAVGPIPPLEVCTGTIGDFVWQDNDRDGIQDSGEPGIENSGEPGIENVLVELLDSIGEIIATDRTDANGEYGFTGLCAGNYTVRISSTDSGTATALDGLDPTLISSPGSDPTNDSDDHGGTPVNLPTDDSNDDTIDFGYTPPVLGMIGDFVWEDTNGNGIQDAGEGGIQGITVNLYNCSDDLNPIDSTSTLSDGSYKFNDVAAGSYFVEFDAGTNYQFSPANEGDDDKVDSDASTATTDTQVKRTGCFSFDPAEWPDGFDDTRDAGLYLPVSLGDFVWDDLNENGQQDPGEPGVNGVTATLSRFNDCNDPSQGTTLEASTETATGTPLNNPGGTPADGYYSFTGLQPGCYKVTFSFKQQDYPAYIFTVADQLPDLTDSDADPANGMTGLITLDSGESNPTIDAGIYQPDTAQLGNFIWLDLNADGIQDPNEDGIEGAKAQLYSCGNLDEPVAGVAEQTTLADGSYLFDNLPSGSYAVKFTVPADAENPYMFSPDNQGTDDTIDSDADAISPGDTMAFSHCVTLDVADENLRVNRTVDAGVYQKASIGDFVWFDEDRDGIQDPGESGLGLDDFGNPIEVTVNLYTCTGTTRDAGVFDSTTADATTGFYEFTDLVPDNYAVEFVSPDGFVFSPQNQGVDDAADSDADSSGSADCTNLVSGENDPTWDAGLNKPAQAALEIIKKTNDTDNDAPTGPYITVGDMVTWTYIVTNTGTEDLSNVVLTDDSGTAADTDDVLVDCYSDPDYTTPSSDLPMDGALYCQLTNDDPGATAGQYGNIGEVCGDYQEYNEALMQFETKTICASDPDYYFGATPSIDIRKQNDDSTGDPGNLEDVRTVVAGSDVTFTITVTNDGELPLDSIAISDFIDPDNLGLDDSDCLRMFNEIPPSELLPSGFHTFTCTIPNVTGNFTNTACADAKVAGKAAEDPYLVEDCDTSQIIVVTPAIDIEKATNLQDADSAPGVQLAVGDTATFTYVVTTNGDEPIGNVTVTDDQGLAPQFQGGDSNNDGLLDPTETWTYTASTTVTAGQYTNIGSVNGIGNGSLTPVSDTDPSNHFGGAPAIDIQKATNLQDADSAPGVQLAVGDTATFTYVVTTGGNEPINTVTVTDDQGLVPVFQGGDSNNDGLLDPTETWTYTASTTVTAGQYTNIGSVNGIGNGSLTPVSDTDPSNHFGTTAPAISLVKVTSDGIQADGDGLRIAEGTEIAWKYTVENIGDVALVGINLEDDPEGTIVCPQNTLAVDEDMECVRFGGKAVAGEYANSAEVCGTDATGTTPDEVCAIDTSSYFGEAVCELTLNKMCFIAPPPPSSEFFCDKPIDSLTMIWDGAEETVWVRAWKGEVGSTSLGVQSVSKGEEVTFTGFAGSPNDVFWEVYSDAGLTNKIGESNFHLSCSDGDMDGETDTSAFPNDCGKLQGDGKDDSSSMLNLWQLEGMVDANNTLDCTVDDTPTYLQACEFTPDPAPSCETTGNPDTLTWRYDGGTDGSCENSTFNVQGDFQDSCTGSVTAGETITVVDDNGDVYSVGLNDEFTMSLDSAKSISLSNGGGTQSFNLHTSCSQPIEAGLTAGALTLVALDGQRADREVEYAYMVTNLSSGTVTDITISDDKLAVPGSIASLEPGASETLTASAFLETTLTNTATASGFLSGSVCESPADSVTVTAVIPPCDIGIYVDDISDDALKLKLTNNDSRNRLATLEEIVITYLDGRGAIREVKLDGAIYKRSDSDVDLFSPATISEDDWTEADVTKRQLDPGETRTLEVKTFLKTDKEDAVFEVTLKFNEGCEYTFEIDYSDKGTTVQFP